MRRRDRSFHPPTDFYPYHDQYESPFDGNRFHSWNDEYGREPYGGYSAYESIGAGLDGPRSGYYGHGYEPFGVMEQNMVGPDETMVYHSANHGYGVNRHGDAYDIPPHYESMLRQGNDYGFNDEMRLPRGDLWDMAFDTEYLNSENP